MPAQRVLISQTPYASDPNKPWSKQGLWPAHWIALPEVQIPLVAAYKLEWQQPQDASFLLHVSADERYELYLDGEPIGRGPERGVPTHWFFESYQIEVEAGAHLLVARVWSQGAGTQDEDAQTSGAYGKIGAQAGAPFAQEGLKHGFLLCPDDETLAPLLATGQAPWQGAILGGIEWISPLCAWGTGDNVRVGGRNFSWDFQNGAGDNWQEVEATEHAGRLGTQAESGGLHGLVPALLPPMLDEERVGFRVRHVSDTPAPTSEIPILQSDSIAAEMPAWQTLLNGQGSLTIPAHTKRRVVVDLENYFCARPDLRLTGGRDALVRVHWVEGLYENFDAWNKGDRDQIENKFFTATWNRRDGVGDQFIADGAANRHFTTLWWQAGRYIEIYVETADEPITIEHFALRETRYPLEMESRFASSDPALAAIVPIMTRVLQMCAHETYMDCPYYEQLMYVGDTRLQALVTYALTGDDRLPRKALKMFDVSRLNNGLTQSRFPSRVPQVIPPFSLWWVAMVHDFALWRDDADFVRSLLPGVRAVCDYFAGLIRPDDGLLGTPDGWNYVDWVPGWRDGCAPDAQHGVSAILCFQAVLALQAAGELETWHGQNEIADLQNRRARELAAATDRAFWDEARGLYADDLEHQNWSEHAQCLAILSGLMPNDHRERAAKGLLETPDLARTTIYFSHYLLETLRELGQMEAFFARLRPWNELVENGLKTTVEMPEPTRSDCHAWGAHPLFHYFATLAGVRPTAPGFASVRVAPQVGHLEWLEVSLPHPRGEIRVRYRGGATEVEVPDGIVVEK